MSKKAESPKEQKPEETPKEEVKPGKPEKAAKPEKKKRPDKKIHTLYRIEKDKVTRLRPTCERCGTGYFMADHGNRFTCGHCGFTKYKRAENEQA